MPTTGPQSPPGADRRADRATGGLRERKKARTRASIQSHALALFAEQGYEATTVAQIADAAELSESTFFRYFPTKADVVLWDEFDPLIVAAVRRQPLEVAPIAALRAAIRDAFTQLSGEQLRDQRERARLAYTIPELRARMLDQLVDAMALLAEELAARTGRRVDELAVRVWAGAVIGAILGASLAIIEDPDASFEEVVDEALAVLESDLSSHALRGGLPPS